MSRPANPARPQQPATALPVQSPPLSRPQQRRSRCPRRRHRRACRSPPPRPPPPLNLPHREAEARPRPAVPPPSRSLCPSSGGTSPQYPAHRRDEARQAGTDAPPPALPPPPPRRAVPASESCSARSTMASRFSPPMPSIIACLPCGVEVLAPCQRSDLALGTRAFFFRTFLGHARARWHIPVSQAARPCVPHLRARAVSSRRRAHKLVLRHTSSCRVVANSCLPVRASSSLQKPVWPSSMVRLK